MGEKRLEGGRADSLRNLNEMRQLMLYKVGDEREIKYRKMSLRNETVLYELDPRQSKLY